MTYPQALAEELFRLGEKPTMDVEWDRAILSVLQKRKREERTPWLEMHRVATIITDEQKRNRAEALNLTNPDVYAAHANMVSFIANNIALAPQRRHFECDDNNKDILRFMLYYFNNCPLAEDVFPDRGYKLHKNLMIQGGVGSGKTMLMQIFSEYTRRIKSTRFFYNLSVTQMVNYYTIHNNLDRYTYHEEESKGFQCQPENICLNDIGIQDKTFFGMDTGLLTDEFLHARNEIWTQFGKFAHLTTNLNDRKLKERFDRNDGFGRLVDRFKTYNVIPLPGGSRR